VYDALIAQNAVAATKAFVQERINPSPGELASDSQPFALSFVVAIIPMRKGSPEVPTCRTLRVGARAVNQGCPFYNRAIEKERPNTSIFRLCGRLLIEYEQGSREDAPIGAQKRKDQSVQR
jgi:hypothetical protein